MEKDDLKLLVDKFWAYGDAVAGFQVVQVVGFLIALGSSTELHAAVIHGRIFVAVLVLIFAFIYSLAVTKCHKIENELREEAYQLKTVMHACSKAKQMRIWCIWVFGVFGIVAIWLQ